MRKVGTMIGFLVVGSTCFITIITSKAHHKESQKLQNLNKIFHNPKARIAIGKKEGKQILKKIQKKAKYISDNEEESDEIQ